jgi:hypothetical protein
MHDLLHDRTALLAQLIADFQIEGPVIYSRPTVPVNPAPRFTPYAQCPALMRAMLISRKGRMHESLVQDVRLLGS